MQVDGHVSFNDHTGLDPEFNQVANPRKRHRVNLNDRGCALIDRIERFAASKYCGIGVHRVVVKDFNNVTDRPAYSVTVTAQDCGKDGSIRFGQVVIVGFQFNRNAPLARGQQDGFKTCRLKEFITVVGGKDIDQQVGFRSLG